MEFISLYFFFTLILGFFLVYIFSPKSEIILKNPNPDNINQITYIDDNNVCYKYIKKKIECPLNDNDKIVYY